MNRLVLYEPADYVLLSFFGRNANQIQETHLKLIAQTIYIQSPSYTQLMNEQTWD